MIYNELEEKAAKTTTTTTKTKTKTRTKVTDLFRDNKVLDELSGVKVYNACSTFGGKRRSKNEKSAPVVFNGPCNGTDRVHYTSARSCEVRTCMTYDTSTLLTMLFFFIRFRIIVMRYCHRLHLFTYHLSSRDNLETQ
jgi:hypothetical protein